MHLKLLLKKYLFTLLVIASILYLSLAKTTPDADMPKIPYADKIVHGLMYFGVMLAFYFDLWRQGLQVVALKRRSWVGALAFALFGGVVELLQMYCTTYRSGDWWDWVADIFGVVLGVWLRHYIVPWVSKWLPRWLEGNGRR